MTTPEIQTKIPRPETTGSFAHDALDVLANQRAGFFSLLERGSSTRCCSGYTFDELLQYVPAGEHPSAVALDSWGRVWWTNPTVYWTDSTAWYRSPHGRLMPCDPRRK